MAASRRQRRLTDPAPVPNWLLRLVDKRERKLSFDLTGAHHRLEDFHVPGAATEIARESFTNGCVVEMRIPFQQTDSGDHHPGCADAALRAAALDEGLLHGM